MARKKAEMQPITGITTNPDEKLTIMKSNPLLTLWRSDMRLSEFKILDLYLSRINSHVPEKRAVTFERGELEQALGVTRILKKDLQERLKAMHKVVTIEKPSGGFKTLVLFEEADAEPDKNGQWRVTMRCTQSAMEYIFNIEEMGYLRYKLRSVKNITSRYSYILFLYLEQNRWRKSWEVSVEYLRELLSCDQDPTYVEFKRFNDLILKKCKKELTDKTELRFDYKTVKAGKKVKGIRFTLETLSDSMSPVPAIEELPGQANLFDDYEDVEALDDFNDPNALYAEALPPELTPEEVEALRAVAAPYVFRKLGSSATDLTVADYLRSKTRLMLASKRKVNNKFRYLLAMIQKEANEQE